jgi:hypothetical protein
MSLDWNIPILESNDDVAKMGCKIATVVDGKDFNIFATPVLALLAAAATPQLTAVAAIAKLVSYTI